MPLYSFRDRGEGYGSNLRDMMNATLLGMLNGWEIVLIVAVVLLMFGARKLPDLARGMGQGIKEFRKATKEDSSNADS